VVCYGLQEKFKKFCKEAEEITTTVSALDMFSPNEKVEDTSPEYLKFLMLPYLLGSLWNGKDGMENRAEHLQMAQIYLKDFFTRLIQYGAINPTIATRNLLVEEGSEGSGDTVSAGPSSFMTDDEKREDKLRKYRERKILGQRIALIEQRRGVSFINVSAAHPCTAITIHLITFCEYFNIFFILRFHFLFQHLYG
jgi:hypothetical protein